MNFRPDLVKLISQKKKNMTRRPVKTPTCPYRVGRAYQVQAGRRRGLFPITVHAIRQERLGDIGLKDVRREGFVTTAEFVQCWTEIYGRFDPDLLVWAISFTLGDMSDTPRLLAASPGAPHGDYVSEPRLAMTAEPEAISKADSQRYSTFARARDDDRRKQQLRDGQEQLIAGVRLVREAVDGDGFDRDAKKTVRALEHHVRALDRKVS